MDYIEQDYKGRDMYKQAIRWWFPIIDNDIQ